MEIADRFLQTLFLTVFRSPRKMPHAPSPVSGWRFPETVSRQEARCRTVGMQEALARGRLVGFPGEVGLSRAYPFAGCCSSFVVHILILLSGCGPIHYRSLLPV